MATVQDTIAPGHADLKARLAALNCELHEDESEGSDRFYVLDKSISKLVSVGATIEDTRVWCAEEEIASRTSSWRSRGKTLAAAPDEPLDERLLSPIVIAGLCDRLESMQRRRD